jgi:hypothetical protein
MLGVHGELTLGVPMPGVLTLGVWMVLGDGMALLLLPLQLPLLLLQSLLLLLHSPLLLQLLLGEVAVLYGRPQFIFGLLNIHIGSCKDRWIMRNLKFILLKI